MAFQQYLPTACFKLVEFESISVTIALQPVAYLPKTVSQQQRKTKSESRLFVILDPMWEGFVSRHHEFNIVLFSHSSGAHESSVVMGLAGM